MSVEAKRELLFQVSPRYREATHVEKSVILKADVGYNLTYNMVYDHFGGTVGPAGHLQRESGGQ